jgi:DNA transformation protein
MAVTNDFLTWVLEQLADLGRISTKRMFGGVGFYHEGVFFAFMSSDTVFFKTDDGTRAAFESRGMRPFRPYINKPQVSLQYYEVPPEVLEDAGECARWARLAVAAAVGKTASPRARTRRIRRGQDR